MEVEIWARNERRWGAWDGLVWDVGGDGFRSARSEVSLRVRSRAGMWRLDRMLRKRGGVEIACLREDSKVE